MIDQYTRSLKAVGYRPALPVRVGKQMPWGWIGLFAVLVGGLATSGYWFWARCGAVEAQKVQLASRIGGRVVAVYVEEGQVVEAGQVLLRFEDQELSARRDQAQARLVAAKADLERVDQGVLPEEIAEAKAAVDAAQARLDLARAGPPEEQKRQAQGELDIARTEQRQADADFARAERLLRVHAISQAEYDAALAVHDRAGLQVRIAQAALDLMLHGSRPEAVAEAQAEFNRVQAHYDLLRRGPRSEDCAAAEAAVALAQAQLAEAEAALRETVVTASERCMIAEVRVRPGSVVDAGQPVIVAY